MRHILAAFVIIASLVAPARAALPDGGEFSSTDAVSRWIANYRTRPDPARLPAAVRALSGAGVFKEPEGAGIYLGFIAGVLGANPDKAEELIGKMLSIAPMDHWIIVRAIAYSGSPDWQQWMRKFADRMQMRKTMIEHYLDGRSPTLYDIPLERKESTVWDKVVGHFRGGQASKASVVTLDRSPDLLDTLWGCYFATGSQRPIERIITLLPWTNERDSVDKLTMGNMAKYTLASNAARDPALLAILKRDVKTAPRRVAAALNEVIEAADTVETTRLRKDALAAIDELKRKGPGSKRDVSSWGLIGQGALAIGCIAAAATGHIELGLPCIIGGAASGAAMSYWNGQQ
ncbi:MAG TPA: hypothetical protein VH678_14615 [Xanthobacteraceae bacterium]|jgi:hypothetical protein